MFQNRVHKSNHGCFTLRQADRSETAGLTKEKMERHFPNKPGQPRGMAFTIFFSFTLSLTKVKSTEEN